MTEPTTDPALNGTGSLLAGLGALRAQREAETTTDLPLPGFGGRLWATFRLPRTEKATQVQAMLFAGAPQLLGACMELIAFSTAGLYLADPGLEAPICHPAGHPDEGHLRDGFQHLPGGTDDMPITFDLRLEKIPDLCPERPADHVHSPETRVRALFGRDTLVIATASGIIGWALGAGDNIQGALEALSERFVGESKGGPT